MVCNYGQYPFCGLSRVSKRDKQQYKMKNKGIVSLIRNYLARVNETFSLYSPSLSKEIR